MAIKLHRCGNMWIKFGGHPCWRVQSALDEQGVDYEVVEEPWPRKRDNTLERTGQKKYPWIEFEDGTIYREESKDMAETIKAGKLDEQRSARAGAPASP